MIDWLSFSIQLPHPHGALDDGRVLVISKDGEIEKTAMRWAEMSCPSWDARWRVRIAGGWLFFQGNPLKWFQGHNLWGGENVPEMISRILWEIQGLHLENLELQWPDFNTLKKSIIQPKNYKHCTISRVDLTRMVALPSRVDAVAWVRALGETATMSYRGRASMTGGTVYFGKTSRRSAMKVYPKGPEFDRALPKFPDEVISLLRAYADCAVRFEAVVRGEDLKKRGLRWPTGWNSDSAGALWGEMMEKIQFAENVKMTDEEERFLPSKVRATYRLWRDGHDLPSLLPRRTFYRHKKLLAEHGINILASRPKIEASNILPFVRKIEAQPMGVPDWAQNSYLFWDEAI